MTGSEQSKLYYRILPAQLPQDVRDLLNKISFRHFVGIVILLFSVLFTGVLVYLLVQTYGMYQQQLAQKKTVEERLQYWDGIAAKHPQFPAAYYEAAVNAVRLEQFDRANAYLEKALKLDPNFFEAEALAKEFNKE